MNLEEQLRQTFANNIGKAWDKLTDQDLKVLDRVFERGKDLYIQSLEGSISEKDFATESKVLSTTLLNLTIGKRFALEKVFWNSMKSAAKVLASIAAEVAISAVSRNIERITDNF